MKFNKIIAILAVTAGLAAAPAQASGYAHALLGFSSPSTTGTGSGFGFGVRGGTILGNMIQLGGFFNRVSASVTNSTTSVGFTTFGAEGLYQFLGTGIAAGARVGLNSSSVSVGTFSVSSTSFTIGPVVNWDYMITEMFSIGADISYLFIAATNSAQIFSAFATFGVHF